MQRHLSGEPAAVQSYSCPVRIEDVEEVDSILRKIASGRAVLEVVAYPWGVEMSVREEES